MDLLNLMKERRSIRKYQNIAIDDKDIEELIEAAMSAPSAGNIQPWDFIIIKKRDIKEKLVKAALGQKFILDAPLVIVVCVNNTMVSRFYGNRGVNLYCIQDTAAAIQNMLLLSRSKGIGSCWIGALSEREVAEILEIPENIRPIAIISFGYPDEDPKSPNKRKAQSIIHYELF